MGWERHINKLLSDASLLQVLTDSSTPGRVITGFARPNVAQTDPGWFIIFQDTVGTQGQKGFAIKGGIQVAEFVHKFSERSSILPAKAFLAESSYQFSGSAGSYGLVPDSSDLDYANTAAYSMGIWFKTTNGAATLWQKTSSAGGNNGYWMQIDGMGRYEFSFRGVGTGDRIRIRTDAFDLGDDGSWNFAMVTKASGSADASTMTIYTGNDGTLSSHKAPGSGGDFDLNVLNNTLSGDTTNSGHLTVAANITGGGRLACNMKTFHINNVELTSSEVTEIYNNNLGVINMQAGSGQISADLISYWRFGDGSYTGSPVETVPDEEGANTMTLQEQISGSFESEVPP